MLAPLLAAVLAAAPAPSPSATAAKAQAMASAKQWDELYLAFGSANPASYGKGDQAKVAKALAEGCLALVTDDAPVAYSLGEKSVAFGPSADGLYCLGLSATRTEQPAAADEALRSGLTRFPKDHRFPLELGRLLAIEGDTAGARGMLGRIPKKAPEWAEAQGVLKKLASVEKPAADEAVTVASPPSRREGRGGPRAPDEGQEPPRPGGVGRGPPPSTGTLGYESSVDDEGRRVRANKYFHFRYFNSKRDFGQRAEYEGKVQAALEEARQASERIIGVSRTTPTDVILYSRAEFELHHGAQAAQMIAGFYSQSAIRMNDTAEINPHNQAVLVHEYVHAVVDELTGFHHEVPIWLNEGLAEYTEWQYEGHDGPEGRLGMVLKQQALAGKLPPLSTMANGALINSSNPPLAYAYAASAVRVMVGKRGVREVVELIRDLGKGQPFEAAFKDHYGQEASAFDTEVLNDLRQ